MDNTDYEKSRDIPNIYEMNYKESIIYLRLSVKSDCKQVEIYYSLTNSPKRLSNTGVFYV